MNPAASVFPAPAALRLFGIPVADIRPGELHQFLAEAIRRRRKALVLNVNVHCVTLALRNPRYKKFLCDAPLVFCDGDGVRWGLRLLGHRPPPKITYASWLWDLAAFCERRHYSLYFLGARPGVADLAARRLQGVFPGLRIAGIYHGYFDREGPENERVIQDIRRVKPDILIVGLGMPIQEEWLSRHWQRMEANIFLTGGAVFDYASGTLRRAPGWMRTLHLEWLFRFLQEPRRLFKRYVFGNLYFFYRVLAERILGK